MRATETALDPMKLTGTLLHYSERRGEYVRTLESIIDANELTSFETAQLATEETPRDGVEVARR